MRRHCSEMVPYIDCKWCHFFLREKYIDLLILVEKLGCDGSARRIPALSSPANSVLNNTLQSTWIFFARENAGLDGKEDEKESLCDQLSVFVPLNPTADFFLVVPRQVEMFGFSPWSPF